MGWRGSPPSSSPRPGQPPLKSECTQHTYLRDRQHRDHSSATGLGASGSHRPTALRRGSSKGAARLMVSQATGHSCGCPSLALPEGTCVHPSLGPQQPSCLGTDRTSVELVSWQRGWMTPSKLKEMCPHPSTDHTSSGSGGSMAQHSPRGDAASVGGSQPLPGWRGGTVASNTRAPKLPSTLRPLFAACFMCAEERMRREGGRQAGRLGCGMEDRPAYPHLLPAPLARV